MQPIKINITKPLTPEELFFSEKALELLFKETIDTYRIRLNNPRSVLTELIQVIHLVNSKTIREEYAKILCDETSDLLAADEKLVFKTFQKQFLITRLKKQDLKSVLYVATVTLNENREYCQAVYDKILVEIARLNALHAFDPKEYHYLSKLIGYFFIELRAKGYSKEYLHYFVRANLSPKTAHADFDAAIRGN